MMKRLLCIAAVALTGCATAPQSEMPKRGAAQITNYETPGNLQANAVLGCVPLSAVTNQHTPADIYPGMAACIKAGDYAKASRLFALAGTYGRFDRFRVLDRTAWQAVTVLRMNSSADFTPEQEEQFKNTLLPSLEEGSSGLAALCASVERVGPPDYYPAYMIQHGMGGLFGGSGDGINPAFDARKGWRDAMSAYLHCS